VIVPRKAGKSRRGWEGWGNAAGFTLPEVLVAVLVLIAAIVPLMTAFIYGTRWTAESRDLITAVNLAQGKLEELKNVTFEEVKNEPAVPDAPLLTFDGYPGYSYRVIVSGAEGTHLKTVTVAVYYEAATGRKNVSVTMDRGDWNQ